MRATETTDDGRTGASPAWTSDEPDIVQARRLVARGSFNEAERLLWAGARGGAGAEMLEMIRRLRLEYGLDEPSMLAAIRGSIPDVSAADLARWRDADSLQYRLIDGRISYFRREPLNLLRFCEQAKRRRVVPDDPPPAWKLTDHLAQVISAAEQSGQREVMPVRHRIRYRLTVPPGARHARAGSLVRAWLPYAQVYRQQKDVKLIGSDPAPTVIAENGSPHRTLYCQRTIDDPARPIEFNIAFEYTSFAYYTVLRDELARPLPASWGDIDLIERPPHIVFSPGLMETVRRIIADEANPLARARRIFHWIDANVSYCAEEEYCLIPSLSIKAMESLKGDCGVQAMLFIAMCRAAGIPARWQSGWETKPVNWNMHDWAEFYVDPWGWLPADVSYGLQKSSDDPKVREFYFGHQDSFRLITNTDYGQYLIPPKRSLRSEPADFQRGEVEIDDTNLYFDEWDYEFSFEQEPSQL